MGGFVEDVTGLDVSNNSRSDQALNAQRNAANQSNALQSQVYNQTRDDNSAYQQAGLAALANMQDASFNRSFDANSFQADPGYQFRMAEGLKAINNSAAARGGRLGGATLKALSAYSGNLASEEYGNAYNRYTNDQTNRYNRLATLAGYGQNANAINANAGAGYASNVSQNLQGVANAQAGQAIGQANQFSGLLGQGAQAAALAFSDERLKTNIVPVSKEELAEMRKHLKAYRFNYSNQDHGEGEFVGVMAQDLEKSPLGRSLVREDRFGNKQVDLLRVAMLFLATQAEAS